jgi:hypothetical protein
MGIEALVTDLSLQEVYKKSTRKLQESLIKTCGLLRISGDCGSDNPLFKQ